MKKVFVILVVAAAAMASCNNSGAEVSATSTKSVDSAMQAAPDSIKAAPLDTTAMQLPAKTVTPDTGGTK